MYVKVYSPAGEMFEVNRHHADELILQQGWTQSCPEIVPVEAVEEVESSNEEEEEILDLFSYSEEADKPKRRRGRPRKTEETE